MDDSFEVKWQWQAYDGYAGGARPQQFNIDADELDTSMTDSDIDNLFNEELQQDFLQTVEATADNYEDFMEWAKEVIAAKCKAEND